MKEPEPESDASGQPAVLLALDIGNTNLTAGLFHGRQLKHLWRIATSHRRSTDEYGLELTGLLGRQGVRRGDVHACAMASVVPPLNAVLAEACRRYFHCEPMVVGPELRGLPGSRYDDPRALGADRLANAVAAWFLYRHDPRCTSDGHIAVVDFGTATKLEVVSREGVYLGGAIAPGIGISAQALYRHAARLPRVEIQRPAQVLGRNNVAAIQSGLVFGFVGQVEGLLDRVARELGSAPFAVATGGYARLVAGQCPTIQEVDLSLTLMGIRLLWQWNRPA